VDQIDKTLPQMAGGHEQRIVTIVRRYDIKGDSVRGSQRLRHA
jgi:hypothetical protein